MQNDRYSSSDQFMHCTWCVSEYVVNASRARENMMFCTKKCELEARFWLREELVAIDRVRKVEPPELEN
jgi:hypothetical protein